MVSCTEISNHNKSRTETNTSLNFKKANWSKYTEILESELYEHKINFKEYPDRLCDQINSIIINTARKCIPRGRQRNYKCFWNQNLTRLGNERDMLRKMAEETKALQMMYKNGDILLQSLNEKSYK